VVPFLLGRDVRIVFEDFVQLCFVAEHGGTFNWRLWESADGRQIWSVIRRRKWRNRDELDDRRVIFADRSNKLDRRELWWDRNGEWRRRTLESVSRLRFISGLFDGRSFRAARWRDAVAVRDRIGLLPSVSSTCRSWFFGSSCSSAGEERKGKNQVHAARHFHADDSRHRNLRPGASSAVQAQ
jgi:hypothetical protein